MPRLSARSHLLGLIAAAVLPVWLFAAYILTQFALNERQRFEQEALQTAWQLARVVEGDLANLLTVLDSLSKSAELLAEDFEGALSEAIRLAEGTDRVVQLGDYDGRTIFSTRQPAEASTAPFVPLSSANLAKLRKGAPVVSDVYQSPVSEEYRVAAVRAVETGNAGSRLLAITIPTSRIRDVMMPAAPDGWILAVGDSEGAYVARSTLHEELTGQAGLPAYLENVVGPSGTFTSHNFQGETLLAGYYRSREWDWFYTANVPLSVVQAPLWRSLAAICAIGLLAMLVSAALAYVVGKRIAGAARALASSAKALGEGQPVLPLSTAVAEFAVIADALTAAERALAERKHELETVMETVPAAVWFTYDPKALQVIRNRFAAELMGLPTDTGKSYGTSDMVIDTIAVKDGQTVSREDRPLSRAMRGEQTDNEEFAYYLPSGGERVLLSSARPIRGPDEEIVGAVQISLDITDRKRSEEQRKMLVHELNHRVKNTLAVVQSISSQTLRNASSIDEAERTLSSRFVSLSKAHDILTQENWSGADLRQLITTSVTPHADLDRFEVTGESVWLPPNLALSLALAMHELTTNALKYGSLSVEGGTVSIRWNVDRDEEPFLHLEWCELGGPAVGEIRHKGFGTRMLERLFDSDSSGNVQLSFAATGVVCVLETRLNVR